MREKIKGYGLLGVVLIAVLSVSVAGCTSSTSSNQPASNTSQAVSTTANATTSASASASATPSASASVTPSITPSPTATSTPISLSISGPTTMVEGGGGVWIVYLDGQLPTASQSNQIVWNSGGLPGGEVTATGHPLGPSGPYGSWVIDANGAANTAQGTYTLTATYLGASASYTITRLPNSDSIATPTPTATPQTGCTPTYVMQWVQNGTKVVEPAGWTPANCPYCQAGALVVVSVPCT